MLELIWVMLKYIFRIFNWFYILEFIFLEQILLILSLLIYPLLDCTLTLTIKIFKGYRPWARLFDYFFDTQYLMVNTIKKFFIQLYFMGF